MGWLFAQLWVWLLLSFLVGSLAAHVAIAVLLPSMSELADRDEPGGPGSD